MPTSLGPAEILVILVVALIVLGPNRLPSAAKQVGKTLGELRRWSNEVQCEIRGALDTSEAVAEPVPQAPTPPGGPSTTPTPADLDETVVSGTGLSEENAPIVEPAPAVQQPSEDPGLGPLGVALPPADPPQEQPRPIEPTDS